MAAVFMSSVFISIIAIGSTHTEGMYTTLLSQLNTIANANSNNISHTFHHLGSGSSSYIRWGRTTCPSTCDTTLVYSGRVGGTYYSTRGGAADYLCLPDQPEYSDFTPGSGGNQARQVWFVFCRINVKV